MSRRCGLRNELQGHSRLQSQTLLKQLLSQTKKIRADTDNRDSHVFVYLSGEVRNPMTVAEVMLNQAEILSALGEGGDAHCTTEFC